MISMEIEIHPAEDSHIPGIIEIWKELMDFHKDIDPLFTRTEDGHVAFADHMNKLIHSEDAQVLVALDKEAVVAYSVSEIFARPPVFQHRISGFISDLAVRSNYQRKGIGEQMLCRMFEWFKSRNICRIELRVASKNEIGYSFWKKHGFQDYMHILYLQRK